MRGAQSSIERLQSPNESESALRELIERVELSETAIRLSLARRIDIPLLWSAQQQVLRLAQSPHPTEEVEKSSAGAIDIAVG